MSRWLFSSVLLLTSNLCTASLGAGLRQTVARMPLYFEPNRGQVAGETQWITRAAGANVYITGSEVVFALLPKTPREAPSKPLFTHNVHMKLVGASRDAKAEGLEPLGSYSSYFAGKTEKEWFTGIPHYGRVRYKDVYPGIDLVYYGTAQNVEYDFEVSAGADASEIELAFDGVDSVRADDDGNLVINAAGHELRQRRPRVLQGVRELPSSYEVDGRRVRLRFAGVSDDEPLLIDPVLEFSTYIGGPGLDTAQAVAIDSNGFIYVAGETQSPASPTLDPFQQPATVFLTPLVLKFTPNADRVVYFSVIGSNGWDSAYSIAVDSSGSAVIFGSTRNPNFPVKNAIQTEFKAAYDNTFVTRLSPDGKSLAYSTYYGGTYWDSPKRVILDGQGDAIIAGITQSRDIPTRNALQPTSHGDFDCFLAELTPAGTLVFSTYFGGSGMDTCWGLAIDKEGSIYISGDSNSPDFPLQNAIQTDQTPKTGFPTAYVAKLSADGSALLFSSFIGGPVSALATSISIDTALNIYVAGVIHDGAHFLTKNAFQNTGGYFSGFLMKLDRSRNVVFSTYLGGTGLCDVYDLAVDQNGSAYVYGRTESGDFPTKDSLQAFQSGPDDGFLTKFTPSGGALVYSTFLGGTRSDWPTYFTLDSSGSAYVAGFTTSTDFPVKNGFQSSYGGGTDGFLAKISDTAVVSPPPLTASPGTVLFQFVQGGPLPSAQTISVNGNGGFAFSASATWLKVSASAASAPATFTVSLDSTGVAPGTYTGTIIITPQSGGPTVINATLTILAAAPVLQNISPAFVPIGSGDTTVTLQGSGFMGNTIVQLFASQWKDTPVLFVDSSTLRFVVPSKYFNSASADQFSVQNPQSAVSNAVVLSIGIPAPQVSNGGVVNAASYAGNSVSPGEIVTIFGANFGSQDNTQVLFDGIAAKVIYVTPAQLSATVPYAIANSTTSLVIQSQGQRSTPVVIPVVPATPAIFTTDASGKGQGAILNQDSTINGATNPAAAGSVVVLYGTGGGILTSDSPARLALPVSVTIGGMDAPVLYAGIAPGLVSGAIQVNVQVPIGVPSGADPVILQVGDARSRSDVTLAVQ